MDFERMCLGFVLLFLAIPVIIEIDYRVFYCEYFKKHLSIKEENKNKFLLASMIEILCMVIGFLLGLSMR